MTPKTDRAGVPATLWIGLGLIALCEVMLIVDVQWRGGRVLGPGAALPDPGGAAQMVVRWFSRSMTPLCWAGFLCAIEGLLTWLARRRGERGGCVRRRPWLFVACFLTSIPVWCYWDWINFYFMDAWRYYGMPPRWYERYFGYFIAFGAISPGMFLAAQLWQRLGLRRLRTRANQGAALCIVIASGVLGVALTLPLMHVWRERMTFGVSLGEAALLLVGPAVVGLTAGVLFHRRLTGYLTALGLGVGWVSFSIIVANPVGNFVLWVSMLLLLDPINAAAGRPSILRDWRAGRWGRTLALMAGGATCGLLWEFWNYWSATKWVYDLPFLGDLERYRYFEMPLVGFLGFLPFGPTCWVMFQTLLLALPGFAEALPGDDDVM